MYGITTVSEPRPRVRLRDHQQRLLERRLQRLTGPRLRLPQVGLDLRPALLDGVEVRRVRRQLFEPCAPRLYRLLNARHLVRPEVIHHDDVARSKRRREHLAHLTEEDRAVQSLAQLRERHVGLRGDLLADRGLVLAQGSLATARILECGTTAGGAPAPP